MRQSGAIRKFQALERTLKDGQNVSARFHWAVLHGRVRSQRLVYRGRIYRNGAFLAWLKVGLGLAPGLGSGASPTRHLK